MNIDTVLERLNTYTPPEGWGGHIFLLPEAVMRDIYQLVIDKKLTNCIELGTGFGATSCVIAAAFDELGEGQLTTIDRYLHQPVNVQVLMQHVGLKADYLNVVADELGYNWHMADVLSNTPEEALEQYDFCLLDGAHEWEPDALAFQLVTKMLKPEAWLLVDDLDFNLRMIPDWQVSHGDYKDKELDSFQMRMVYDIMVKNSVDYENFDVTHNGRMGWAQKKPTKSWLQKWLCA